MPRLLPFGAFRYLVRLGESIWLTRNAAVSALQDLALEDPRFHADDAVLGAGLGHAELDVGTQRVKGDAPLAVRLDAAHLAAAEAARAPDADALRAELHRRRQRLLH